MARVRILRSMTDEEQRQLRRIARSHVEPFCRVERARAVLAVYGGQTLVATAQAMQRNATTISRWLDHFEERGLAGLDDAPKSGRLPTYSHADKEQLLAVAQTHPQQLEQPFGAWTLDLLVEYAHAQMGIPLSRAHLGRLLRNAGIRWYQEQTFFAEPEDAEFAKKRGPSLRSTSSPLPAAMSSA